MQTCTRVCAVGEGGATTSISVIYLLLAACLYYQYYMHTVASLGFVLAKACFPPARPEVLMGLGRCGAKLLVE